MPASFINEYTSSVLLESKEALLVSGVNADIAAISYEKTEYY